MNKAITISDVALQAGVSVSTASKALCGKGRMGEDTRTRIIQVAKAMGYKPNRAAQALSRKTVSIVALLPDSPKEVQQTLVRGLEDAFQSFVSFNIQYQIIPYRESNDQTEILQTIKNLSGHTDAMIFQGDDSLADAITQYHPDIPIVTLVTGAERFHAVTSVVVDADTVGRLAAQVMAISGAKNTVIMAGREGTYIHTHNIEGYTDAAKKYGICVKGVYYTEDNWENAYESTRKAMESHPDLDGIFVSSYLSPSVCNYLKEHGLSGKVKVIGVDLYDEVIFCLHDQSLLGTVYQNQYLQAKRAVDIVMDSISTGVRSLPDVRMKPELVMQSNVCSYLR